MRPLRDLLCRLFLFFFCSTFFSFKKNNKAWLRHWCGHFSNGIDREGLDQVPSHADDDDDDDEADEADETPLERPGGEDL